MLLRPHSRLADLEVAGLRLLVPRIAALAGSTSSSRAGDAGARQRVGPVAAGAAERQHVEPIGPSAQRVRLAPSSVDDAVALTDLLDLAVLPGEP